MDIGICLPARPPPVVSLYPQYAISYRSKELLAQRYSRELETRRSLEVSNFETL